MMTSPKTRILLLLVAALFTMMSLTLPEATQACPAFDFYDCYYPNGAYCREYDCPSYARSCTCAPSGPRPATGPGPTAAQDIEDDQRVDWSPLLR
jgi:hypothetical protein